MYIESLSNKKIKELNKLKSKKYRDLEGLFLVEGWHLVSEAYNAGILTEVLTLNGNNVDFEIKDDKILVFNQNVKYYISFEKFREDFHLSKFYIFKSLDELEIDQEHHNLRQ